jgi:hypothetical protein
MGGYNRGRLALGGQLRDRIIGDEAWQHIREPNPERPLER